MSELIENFGAWQLRHSFAVRWFEAHGDPNELAHIAGWSLSQYIKTSLSPDQLYNAAARFQAQLEVESG
jgi:hypothetical protein